LNNNQYHTPQLTSAAFVASCAAILGVEVKCSGEVFEVLAKILPRAMTEMILTHCVDVVEGEVFYVYESGLN
jgi:hypothetical protein